MRYSDKSPSVNAGSMADIAFLLLIFFLVTTTISNDKGILRKLPPACPTNDCDIKLKERNVLKVAINKNGEISANDVVIKINELNAILKNFIDNNGDASCEYCTGEELIKSSENPKEATISLTADRNSPYNTFIAVQDELTKAYYQLREKYVVSTLKTDLASLSSEELKQVQIAYPLRITEATTR